MVKIISYSSVILWMTLIFFFSHQPASQSSELSSGITAVILSTIERIGINSEFFQANFHHFIRKSAHFLIYMVLGILFLNSLRVNNMPIYKAMGIALLMSILYAISDEVHQVFVAGRGAQIRDVLIDGTGAGVGIILYIVIVKLASRKKSRGK